MSGGFLWGDERGFETGQSALDVGVEEAGGGEGGAAVAGALAEGGLDGFERGGEPAGDLGERVAGVVRA